MICILKNEGIVIKRKWSKEKENKLFWGFCMGIKIGYKEKGDLKVRRGAGTEKEMAVVFFRIC